jgi:hypothetical protein
MVDSSGRREREYFDIIGKAINTFTITIGESFGIPTKWKLLIQIAG